MKFEQMNTLIGTSKMKQTLIAVVDTGVDSRLTDLSGTVRTDLGANLIGRNKDAIDDNGHGTHVAAASLPQKPIIITPWQASINIRASFQ
nr:S8 family serine peptidase [Bacillus pumilus]